jgi:hypothetical protein
MPTGSVELMVSVEMVLSPPRSVADEFEEPVAEKTISSLVDTFTGIVPPESLDQLLPAVQGVPFDPRQ